MYDEEVQAHEAAYDAYMTGVVFATIAKEKEISDELQVLLDNDDDYQMLQLQLKPKVYDPHDKSVPSKEEIKKEKDEIYSKINEIKSKMIEKSIEMGKNTPISLGYLNRYENKVNVVTDKNKIFYFGKDQEEVKASLENKFNPNKVIWVQIPGLRTDVNKLIKATKDIGDIIIQRDDYNSYYIEFQHFYKKGVSVSDIMKILEERLGDDCKITSYENAELYKP